MLSKVELLQPEGAHDGNKLTVVDFERNAVQGRSFDFFHAEDIGQIILCFHHVYK